MAKTVVVLGARNLGGAIVEHFLDLGWNAAAVARSEESLERVRARGALVLQADASDHQALTGALGSERSGQGLVVGGISLQHERTTGADALERFLAASDRRSIPAEVEKMLDDRAAEISCSQHHHGLGHLRAPWWLI